MYTEPGGQTEAGAQGAVNQLGKISQMQPVWAARGEGHERDIGSGSSLEHVAATWGVRQLEGELSSRVKSTLGLLLSGFARRQGERSECAPDLHLPTRNYAIHLQAIFKLKCCQRVVTVLIFLFCSFPIHPHFFKLRWKGE